MGKRGSEHRQKTKSVLVRVSETDHDRLSKIIERDGGTMAEYLRRRIGEPVAHDDNSVANMLSESDRLILAQCTRSMGHLAGIMKLAVTTLPPFMRPSEVEANLTTHSDELKQIQAQLRRFVEEHTK
jgi:hemerythrin